MTSRYVENPSFVPEVESGLVRALDDVGDEIVRLARADIASRSTSAAQAVHKDRAVNQGAPSVTIHIGKGLGVIFEFSKMGQRRTRKGANRGVMQRHEFFHRNVNTVLSRGLNLARYL